MVYYISVVQIGHADVAQSVERILGKDEVTGSNPVISSMSESLINQRFSDFFNAHFLIAYAGEYLKNQYKNQYGIKKAGITARRFCQPLL